MSNRRTRYRVQSKCLRLQIRVAVEVAFRLRSEVQVCTQRRDEEAEFLLRVQQGLGFAQSAGTSSFGSALLSSRAGIFRRAGFIMASISAGTSIMRCHTYRHRKSALDDRRCSEVQAAVSRPCAQDTAMSTCCRTSSKHGSLYQRSTLADLTRRRATTVSQAEMRLNCVVGGFVDEPALSHHSAFETELLVAIR